MKQQLIIFITAILAGCVSIPDNVTPVTEFETEKYMGTWYEIARLDHWFERDLDQVTANYKLQDNGTVQVINRGFDGNKQEWKEAVGKAKFVDDINTGYLKVSFFGPFYGAYVVFELGENYDYAFVAGNDTDYLWFLSRTPEVSEAMQQHFISKASELGFPTDELIFVQH
jgi:apolipoprotein D and lipocalin family protein